MFTAEALPLLLWASVMLFSAGVVTGVLLARMPHACRWVTHSLALGGTLVVFVFGVIALGGGSLEMLLPRVLPLAGGLAIGVDRLSAFFLVIIAAGVAPSALYAIGYTRSYNHGHAGMGIALNVFIPAMVFVVLARNVLTFLVFWEVMSLASYFLVMTESDGEETRRAGWLYMVMTHAGLACLLIGFLALSQATGSFTMSQWSHSVAGLNAGMLNAVFLVLAAGFLSKAGAIPFHVWLP